jgi:rRNA maturation RNase YbeY
LLQINQSFLGHDDFTDIITFDFSEHNNRHIEGEIYISIDRVVENAMHLGLAFEEEILRVIFHGALHLCGFMDKTEAERAVMTAKEDFYLQMFADGVSRGTS